MWFCFIYRLCICRLKLKEAWTSFLSPDSALWTCSSLSCNWKPKNQRFVSQQENISLSHGSEQRADSLIWTKTTQTLQQGNKASEWESRETSVTGALIVCLRRVYFKYKYNKGEINSPPHPEKLPKLQVSPSPPLYLTLSLESSSSSSPSLAPPSSSPPSSSSAALLHTANTQFVSSDSERTTQRVCLNTRSCWVESNTGNKGSSNRGPAAQVWANSREAHVQSVTFTHSSLSHPAVESRRWRQASGKEAPPPGAPPPRHLQGPQTSRGPDLQGPQTSRLLYYFINCHHLYCCGDEFLKPKLLYIEFFRSCILWNNFYFYFEQRQKTSSVFHQIKKRLFLLLFVDFLGLKLKKV